MTSPINTSLTIQFAVRSEGLLSMEVDSRVEGLNKGMTTFYKGDSPGFLVHRSSNVTSVAIRSTEGGILFVTSGSEFVEEFITFAGERSASFSKPCRGNFSVLSSYGDSYTIRAVAEDGLRLADDALAVLYVRYRTEFSAYRLTGASGDAPVVILATGVVND